MSALKRLRRMIIVSCVFMLSAVVGLAAQADGPQKEANEKARRTVYDYSLVAFDKKEVSLSAYKGKVLLIVNLASQSVFRDQIALLDDLQKIYKEQGLVILGVPSNDFGAQEPGTDADIRKTYGEDLHPTFPVFARVSVRGKDQAPLYAFLTSDKKGPTGGDVHWSYTKFIIDRTGKVVARFEPHIAPNSPELRVTIEDVLAGKYKPAEKKEDDRKAASSDEDEAR